MNVDKLADNIISLRKSVQCVQRKVLEKGNKIYTDV